MKLEPKEMYDEPEVTDYTIGSSTYRRIDYSPYLTTVYIKTHVNPKFIPIKDFFGETAWSSAQRYCYDMITN